ncbi:uncharacterized protein LOC111030237 [Myzus persicae]|uniref:uncharacterized protein LOC111030237 n=1 Tax=Myzus persicae TaxID=13164 RepID=UPI000B932A0B|nr:uncharacterized protein LOC111030237 [Myzus persicae]
MYTTINITPCTVTIKGMPYVKTVIKEQRPMWCKKCGLLTAIKDAFMNKMNAFIKSSSSATTASSSAPAPSGQRTLSASPWTELMMPQPLPPSQTSWWSSPPPSFWWSPPSSSSNWWWWC